MGRFGRSAKLGATAAAVISLLLASGCAAPPGLGTPPVFYPVSVNAHMSWASGDVDNDGAIDLLVVDFDADLLTVLLNDGSGAFATTTQPWPTDDSVSILGDFTSDGRLDLIRSAGGVYSLMAGDGSGGFGSPTPVALAGRPAAASQMNADSHLDLVVIDGGTGPVGVQAGNGAGGFAAPTWLDVALPGGAYSVTWEARVEDLNGDGHGDVLARGLTVYCDGGQPPHCNDDSWSWAFLGDGAGGFAPRVSSSFGWGGVVADFDEDGNVDTATNIAYPTTKEIDIALGDGTGAFPAHVRIPTEFEVCRPAAADLDSDGDTDLITGAGQDQGRILYGDGTGGFPRIQVIGSAGAPTETGICTETKTLDLDGDGKPDVLSLSDTQDRLAVLLNRL